MVDAVLSDLMQNWVPVTLVLVYLARKLPRLSRPPPELHLGSHLWAKGLLPVIVLWLRDRRDRSGRHSIKRRLKIDR